MSKDNINEVAFLSRIRKTSDLGWQNHFDNFKSKHIKDYHTVLDTKHYKIYRHKSDDSFIATDHDDNPLYHVNGQVTQGGFMKIDGLVSNKNGPKGHPLKAHHLYHDMMHNKIVNGFITDGQSPGGMKVWQRLNKLRDVNIHGWDDNNEKPVNLGRVFRPDETHVDEDEYGDDFQKYREERDELVKKSLSSKRHIDPKISKEMEKLDDDRQDLKNQRDMHLVAHLKRKPKQLRKIAEDVPAVSVASGAVAGLGIGPQGEPPVRKRGKFGKHETFLVSPHTFLKARNEKKKGAHWRKYLEEDDNFNDIREYAFKRPKDPIILQCERTGAMCFARYGHSR